MTYLLGGVRSFQHRGVLFGHFAVVVPTLFPCEGI